MTDFSFLSFPTLQPLQDISPKLPPLITLDDYSVGNASWESSTQNYSEPLALGETPSAKTHSLYHHDHSTPNDSDSDVFYPPSSAVPSETSSAVVSESDLPSAAASESDFPSAVASESDLLLQPQSRSSGSKIQTGIHAFFRVLPEDEIQALRAKRKQANSEAEEADRAKRRQKEKEEREQKLIVRREQNRIAQQKHWRKVVVADIQAGVQGEDGKMIQVS